MKNPIRSPALLLAALALIAVLGAAVALAENIDPSGVGDQFAWGENVGWLNAEPSGDGGPGIEVTDTHLEGYMWGENIGWISLCCENTESCASVDYCVNNDCAGNLSGYAWGENVGWVSFDCSNTDSCATVDYGVSIDPVSGGFSGNAWGENIGWITFSDDDPVEYGVITSWIATDSDCDGICDPGMANGCTGSDNCPFTPNTDQTNTDNQCDDAADDDLDGYINDGCPAAGDPESACADDVDDDADTVVNDGCPPYNPEAEEDGCGPWTCQNGEDDGPECDNAGSDGADYDDPDCQLDGREGDSHGDACDNCPDDANEDQANFDGDALGDACDPDDDNDGYEDEQEIALGSDINNPDSTPEHIDLPWTCTDGIDNDLDGLPDLFDCDSDGDGTANYFDACPFTPEDMDGYQDDDGCPDADNDMDGICDPWADPLPFPPCTGSDGCPNVAEDYDAFEDDDGCPDADNDGDGFPDHTDDCPATDWTAGADGIPCNGDDNVDTCEDYDGVIDTDGCHDSPGDDNDGDSLGRIDSGTGFPVFWDEVEVYLGTDPQDACPDHSGHDAWPLDINMDAYLSVVGDALEFRGHIGAEGGPPPDPNWDQRLDLNMDNYLSVVGDVLMYAGRIGESCS